MLYLSTLVKPTYHVNYIQAEFNEKFLKTPFDPAIFPAQHHPILGADYRYATLLMYGLFSSVFGSDYPYVFLYVSDTFSIILTVIFIILIGKELKNFFVGFLAGFLYIIYPSIYDWFARVGVSDFYMVQFLTLTILLLLKYFNTGKKYWLFGASLSYFLCLNTRATAYVAIPIIVYLFISTKIQKAPNASMSSSIIKACKEIFFFSIIPLVGFLVFQLFRAEQETKGMVVTTILSSLGAGFFNNVALYFSSGLLGPVLLCGTALWIIFRLHMSHKKKLLKLVLLVALLLSVPIFYGSPDYINSFFGVVVWLSIFCLLITSLGFLLVFDVRKYSFLIVWFVTYCIGLSVMFRTDQIMGFLPALVLIFSLITDDILQFVNGLSKVNRALRKFIVITILFGLVWYAAYFIPDTLVRQDNRMMVGVFAEQVLDDAKKYYDTSHSLLLCQYEARPMSHLKFKHFGYRNFTLGLYEGGDAEFLYFDDAGRIETKYESNVVGKSDLFYSNLKKHNIKHIIAYAQTPCIIIGLLEAEKKVKLIKKYDQHYKQASMLLFLNDVFKGHWPPRLFIKGYVETIYLIEIL